MIPRVRLVTLIGGIFILAFAALGVFNFQTIRESVHKEIIHSSLPMLSENILSEIERNLLPPVNIASLMAHDSFLINWALAGEGRQASVIEYLRHIQQQYNYFSVFYVSDKTKNYYHFNGLHKRISRTDSHDVWYWDFINSGREYMLDVDRDQAAGNALTIFINYRVNDFEGRLLGVTGVGLRMENFSQFLARKQERYHRTIYLVDELGIIQAHSNLAVVQQVSLNSIPGLSGMLPSLLVKKSQPVDAAYDSEHGRTLVSCRYIPEIDWYLIVEQSEDEALEAARNSLWLTVVVGILLSALIVVILSMVISRHHKQLEQLAATDDLTGLDNRRMFNLELERAVSRFNRYGNPLSLMVIDVDHFKEINDSMGHQQGDSVLVVLGRIVKSILRPDDHFSRWGGDEFALLANATVEDALVLAKRIQAVVSGPEHWKGRSPTLSVGIALMRPGDTSEDLLRRADAALYEAKSSGRNCISVAGQGLES